MNFACKLGEASEPTEFEDMAERVQKVLARVDVVAEHSFSSSNSRRDRVGARPR